MKPSVSRSVHYVSHGTPRLADGSQAFASECRAAIITSATPLLVEGYDEDNETRYVVSLFVANPTGLFFNDNVRYDVNEGPGTWHWPERV